MNRYIDDIRSPADLRKLDTAILPKVAGEIRKEIVDTVSKTGGHLASSLGAVDLTIAVHYAFNTPVDKILWDVGHQSYAHKILTGRLGKFSTLRQLDGLSGFPNIHESPEFDIVTCGHSSTAISTALGLAIARDLKQESHKVIAVVGDAALAGGMSFEALNHAGHAQKDMIVILNDNELSISRSVGALSRYLNRILINPAYNKIRLDVEKVLKRIPRFGFRAYRAARKLEEGLKNLLIPGMLFEELGFRYFGPIDGHDIEQLIKTFKNLKDLHEPILLHLVTKKGKGYRPAEAEPGEFHGTGPFAVESGVKIRGDKETTFTEAFGKKMVALAEKNANIVAVTAAMLDGTGLNEFAGLFPNRFFDVGIAEEHAITFGAGLARGGFKPFIALYSTFLQRGYDQVIHDICLQDLPVVLCVDRAGLVGEDGATHHGVFDIAYLRNLPNMTVMAPRDVDELARMLEYAFTLNSPSAIRYPRGGSGLIPSKAPVIKTGVSETLKRGSGLNIIAIGSMVETALKTAELLEKRGVSAGVIDARFVCPLDSKMIEELCRSGEPIVTIEEGVLSGGFGSAVLECIEKSAFPRVRVKRIGLPETFIEHGRRSELFLKYDLTPEAICDVIIKEAIYGKS